MRAVRVRFRAPEDYPAGHPGRRGPMMVQQFINTGERISLYRVLTLFGEPLCANRYGSARSMVDLSSRGPSSPATDCLLGERVRTARGCTRLSAQGPSRNSGDAAQGLRHHPRCRNRRVVRPRSQSRRQHLAFFLSLPRRRADDSAARTRGLAGPPVRCLSPGSSCPRAPDQAGGRVSSPFYAAAAMSRRQAGGLFLHTMRARAVAASSRANIARHVVLASAPAGNR